MKNHNELHSLFFLVHFFSHKFATEIVSKVYILPGYRLKPRGFSSPSCFHIHCASLMCTYLIVPILLDCLQSLCQDHYFDKVLADYLGLVQTLEVKVCDQVPLLLMPAMVTARMAHTTWANTTLTITGLLKKKYEGYKCLMKRNTGQALEGS